MLGGVGKITHQTTLQWLSSRAPCSACALPLLVFLPTPAPGTSELPLASCVPPSLGLEAISCFLPPASGLWGRLRPYSEAWVGPEAPPQTAEYPLLSLRGVSGQLESLVLSLGILPGNPDQPAPGTCPGVCASPLHPGTEETPGCHQNPKAKGRPGTVS